MRSSLFVVVALFILGCSPKLEEPAEPTGDAGTTYADGSGIEGETAYKYHCASCHESGESGAPVTGDETQWAGRSQLWQAVLMEHAKAGYLEMPAKGGDPELSDAAVNAAVEYMLSVTFPDRNPD